MMKSTTFQWVKMTLLAGVWFVAALAATAQTNDLAAANRRGTVTSVDPAAAVRAEQLRTLCIQERRCICGRVLKVMTNGVVVDSGYADLMRPSLKGTWHFTATVIASRDPHLVEDRNPGSICVGQVFLTDLPHKRRTKIKINLYDYVVLDAYPAGQFTYTSIENLPHTVRRFACGLETAVKLRLEAGEKTD